MADFTITVTSTIPRQWVDITRHSDGGEPYVLGDDWVLQIYFGEDVSDDEFIFTVKAAQDDADESAVLQKQFDEGVVEDENIALTADEYGIDITIVAGDRSAMATYAGKSLYYDVQRKTGGAVKTVCLGRLHVYPDVTISTAVS